MGFKPFKKKAKGGLRKTGKAVTTTGKVIKVGGQVAANTGRVLKFVPHPGAQKAGVAMTKGGVATRKAGKAAIAGGRAMRAASDGKGGRAKAKAFTVVASSFSGSNTNISNKLAIYPDTTSATGGQSIRVHSTGAYFITQNVDTTPSSSSFNLINSKGVYDAIGAVNTRLAALETRPAIIAAAKYNGRNNTLAYVNGRTNDTVNNTHPNKTATGHYEFQLSPAASSNQYAVVATIIETSGMGDVVVRVVSGQQTSPTFQVKITEQDTPRIRIVDSSMTHAHLSAAPRAAPRMRDSRRGTGLALPFRTEWEALPPPTARSALSCMAPRRASPS